MKKLFLVIATLFTALLLTACTSTQKGAGVGAVAGAVIGGATTGTAMGAAVGAGVGAVTGAVAGELLGRYRDDPTRCVYVDDDGDRFVDTCPRG